MKTAVAVTLIIVGGLLILGPLLSNHLARTQIVAVMKEQGLTSVNLQPAAMSSNYRFGCWFAGSAMIAAAVLMSRRGSRKKSETPPA